jgi:pantothenate kinase
MSLQQLKLSDLIDQAKSILASNKRSILAVAGAPGAGKTTITQSILQALGPENVVIVPMDGFHLSNSILKKWDRRSRKGAWDTFDADGYINLVNRIRNQQEEVVLAPDFDRDIDESIGGAIEVHRNTPLILLGVWFMAKIITTNRSWLVCLLRQCHKTTTINQSTYKAWHAAKSSYTMGIKYR